MEKNDYMNILISMLAEIDFANRYYKMYETLKDSKKSARFTLDDYREAISTATNMASTYNKKEKFFGIRDTWRHLPVKFNIALYYDSAIEFILAINTPAGGIGGTYHGLAHKTALLSQPDFSYSPRYPRLPFAIREELQQVMQFGINIYQEMKYAVQDNNGLFSEETTV